MSNAQSKMIETIEEPTQIETLIQYGVPFEFYGGCQFGIARRDIPEYRKREPEAKPAKTTYEMVTGHSDSLVALAVAAARLLNDIAYGYDDWKNARDGKTADEVSAMRAALSEALYDRAARVAEATTKEHQTRSNSACDVWQRKWDEQRKTATK